MKYYQVIRLQYNPDSWNQGEYCETVLGEFENQDLAQQVLDYELQIEEYEEPENFFKYASGYENVYYKIQIVSLLQTMQEYYNSKS